MNWYKIVQATVPKVPDYTDIGHYDTEDFDNLYQNEYLWIWKNGKVEFKEVPVSQQPVHMQFWPQNLVEKTWSGRYDLEKDIISIASPTAGYLKYKEVPSSLIDQLHRVFSPTAQIWYYGDPNSPSPGIERLAGE